MEKIGFVGAFDKIDLMLYIAKIISTIGKKVLIVDSTINQRGRYIVPTINIAKTYITEFESVDIAVGINGFNELKNFLNTENEQMDYDFIFVDIDSPQVISNFDMERAKINYFVTSFDAYSLKKGLEILTEVSDTIKLKKILFSKYASQEEDDYLNYLSLGMKIEWANERVYFPYELGDQTIIMENQMVSKIKYRKLSNQYKEGLIYIAEEIVEQPDKNKVRKVFKQLEREI